MNAWINSFYIFGIFYFTSGQEILMQNVGTYWFKAHLRQSGHCLGLGVNKSVILDYCKDDLKDSSDQIWRITPEGYLVSYSFKLLAVDYVTYENHLHPPGRRIRLNYNGIYTQFRYHDGGCIDLYGATFTPGTVSGMWWCEELHIEYEDHYYWIDSVDACDDIVGVSDQDNITDSQLSASLSNTSSTGPEFGRLNHPGPNGDKEGWCASDTGSSEPWIQVNFGNEIALSGIIIQGTSTLNHVESFAIEFSYDGTTFKNLVDAPLGPDRKIMYALNSDNTEDDIVIVTWPTFTARILRVVVIQNIGSFPCMRMELLGCSLDVSEVNTVSQRPTRQSQSPDISERAVDGARGVQAECPNIQTNSDVDWWIVELDTLIYVDKINIINGPIPPECKTTMVGLEYQGFKNTTEDGLTCQRWDVQTPHPHSNTNETWFPENTLEEAMNYCRNPDREAYGPWCYTTDPDKRWEYCGIEFCFIENDVSDLLVSVFCELEGTDLVPNFESDVACNTSPKPLSVVGQTTITCEQPIWGKYVVIHTPMNSGKPLLLCEVEVFSDGAVLEPDTFRNSCVILTTTEMTISTPVETTTIPSSTEELTTQRTSTTTTSVDTTTVKLSTQEQTAKGQTTTAQHTTEQQTTPGITTQQQTTPGITTQQQTTPGITTQQQTTDTPTTQVTTVEETTTILPTIIKATTPTTTITTADTSTVLPTSDKSITQSETTTIQLTTEKATTLGMTTTNENSQLPSTQQTMRIETSDSSNTEGETGITPMSDKATTVQSPWITWEDTQASNLTSSSSDEILTTMQTFQTSNNDQNMQSTVSPTSGIFIKYPPQGFKPEFGEWWAWSSCSRSCNVGFRVRFRISFNESIEHQGSLHTEEGQCTTYFSTEHELCNIQSCPFDCEWYGWSDWSDCSSLCGSGTKRRSKIPVGPFNGGKPCKGINFETTICRNEPCPVTVELAVRAKKKALEREPEFLESDYRPTAICIGSSGVILVLVLCGALFVVPDLLSLCRFIYNILVDYNKGNI